MPPSFLRKFIVSQSQKQQSQCNIPSADADWISGTIQLSELVATAGQFAPFPHLKNAVLLFIALLQPVEVIRLYIIITE